VQSYLNFSKSASESQLHSWEGFTTMGAKLSQFFKKRKRITTNGAGTWENVKCKVISIFQKAQANHNYRCPPPQKDIVQSYLNFSKSASESQLME